MTYRLPTHSALLTTVALILPISPATAQDLDLDAIASQINTSPPQAEVTDPDPDPVGIGTSASVATLGASPDEAVAAPTATLPASFEELVLYAQDAGAGEVILSQDVIAGTCAMLANMDGLDGITRQQQRQICAKQGGQTND
jgi:hypothetical protein